MTPSCGPARLASLLASLDVRVESAHVEQQAVSLPDYPDGPRPSSVVCLTGRGHSGWGENVAFFRHEHERFAALVEGWSRTAAASSPVRVQDVATLEGSPYERAALEAALVDLALSQAGISLYDLTGVREASLRFVVSLAVDPNPEAVVRRLRAEVCTADLKVDVDASWAPHTVARLAGDSSIVIFDFKGRASPELCHRIHSLSRGAWLEDPPVGFDEPPAGLRAPRVSRDATVIDEFAAARASARGEAVNLKAPRMGGPLSVLRALEHAPAWAYLGGMFEVNVGRSQARQLAALYCAAAPNDLALNLPEGSRPERHPHRPPAQIRLDTLGFGAR